MRIRSSLFFWFCFFIFANVFAFAQQKSSANNSILELEQKWDTAYRLSDFATMNLLLAEDVMVTVENGSTFSKSGVIMAIDSIHRHFKLEVAQKSDLKIIVNRDTAVVTGVWNEKGTDHGKPYEYHDRFTDVWSRREGRWQLIAAHFSVPVK